MASCNYNTLLTSGKCFAANPTYILNTVALKLWCDISGKINPTHIPRGAIFNVDVNAPLSNPDGGIIVNPDA